MPRSSHAVNRLSCTTRLEPDCCRNTALVLQQHTKFCAVLEDVFVADWLVYNWQTADILVPAGPALSSPAFSAFCRQRSDRGTGLRGRRLISVVQPNAVIIYPRG